MVSVTLRDLVVRYGGGAAVAAVDGVSLSIAPRELFLLLGPSGSGKTTVLRAVAGFAQPDSGSIHFADEDVTRLPAHARNAGMVFQSFALWPHMTVAQNVGFGLREQRVARAEISSRVEAALESTQMKGFGGRRIDELSGGEQQRVALARALVVRPRCLLLDEPLASLDAKLRRSMREEIRRICKSAGLTAIYVTHDQKEALAIADRVAVMERGRILQVGTPGDIYRRPRSRAVAAFVGDTNLFEGRVTSADGASVGLESAIGPLVASSPAGGEESEKTSEARRVFGVGDKVWISVRPECCRPVANPALPPAGNRLRGRVTATIYLGELSEHRLQVGAHALSVYELNPAAPSSSPFATDSTGGPGSDGGVGDMTVEIAPADVILLPFDDSQPAPAEAA